MIGACERCGGPGEGQVHIQWSEADFIDFTSCLDCMWPIQRAMSEVLIEGRPPANIWRTYWDLDEEKGGTTPSQPPAVTTPDLSGEAPEG